jgi:hypothetical protein
MLAKGRTRGHFERRTAGLAAFTSSGPASACEDGWSLDAKFFCTILHPISAFTAHTANALKRCGAYSKEAR